MGLTRKSFNGLLHGFSCVYMETVRDFEFGQLPPGTFNSQNQRQALRNLYFRRLYVTMAHEIGHAPSTAFSLFDHKEGGVMDKEPKSMDLFSPKTISRFRSINSWTRP